MFRFLQGDKRELHYTKNKEVVTVIGPCHMQDVAAIHHAVI